MRKERDETYHGDRSNFLRLRVRGRRKEKSKREKRKKTKKNLIYENEWKKAKTPQAHLNPTWKKRKENKRRELNSLTFQTHLSFTLYTHTQQKNTLNHVPIYASYWQSAFFFSFSFRFASWHWLERDARFCSWKKGYNCCVCRRWLHQNRSIQKKVKS